ncbi:outer membrane protein assembly factor BamB family protein [Paenibacillus ihumii]|uniref:outer membrane protein assembly factor BamB family protein n=1 Tax=Paenibacillus ihumii TaxID=687436 RepID=UPI0006D766F5|nr:PQQ-binding-like beta-propeller repeat protein [Paenibacillus ihumii]
MKLKKLIQRVMIISLLIGNFSAAAVTAEESIHSTNNWNGQSPYAAMTKPEIKWSVDLKGQIIEIVIDSKGVLYVITDGYPSANLWAVEANGKIKWSKDLPANSVTGLTLFNDQYLIVAGNIGTSSSTGISKDDPNKVVSDNPDAIISKYTTQGELVWEQIFEETTLTRVSGKIAVDDDGMVAFAGSFTSVVPGYKSVSDMIHIREETKLIAISPNGETIFNITLDTSPKGQEPLSNSAPTFIKGSIYLTTSKGYMKPISKTSSMGVFDTSTLHSISKMGEKKFSTTFSGQNISAPVYDNNILYVIGDKSLYYYNTDGKLIKELLSKRQINYWTPPVISSQGYLVFGRQVFSPSGKLLWHFDPNTKSYETNLVSLNNLVIDKNQNLIMAYMVGYTSTNSGVIAKDLKTGQTIWRIPLYHLLNTSPTIGKDGTIYIGGTKLFAIGQK